jgi:hypothetical protein
MNYKKLAVYLGSGVAFGLIIVVAALAVRGESSAEAKSDFCSSLDNLSTTVSSYEGLNPRTATNDELDAAYDDIADAYDEVVDDANDWANAYDNPLNEAYNDLYWAVQDLPGDNTAAENYDDLQDELAAFPSAFQETFDGSGCSDV